MKKIVTLFTVILFTAYPAFAQKYFTKTGIISFSAGTSLEDIDAVNKSATSVMDAATGKIEFAVLIRGFEFKRALMQEHFNENYMESSKYPKAVFKGNIVEAIPFNKPGTYTATVKGILEMHGVKKETTAKGTIKVSAASIQAVSRFSVNTSDFNISIPGVVKDKVSPVVNISVNCNYTLLNQ
ncbi:YceI family protein [Niabella yanshanensis]|uniref:YceI family protein n=1 Tax=Niabella yanshanensis TaxID=577386 RepID=A0ABZ0W8B2_9BACT|nr:YceI family protein [Niabella yanshanensis]WQD39189.1 YceI family protein [Niabella yanshanensis]